MDIEQSFRKYVAQRNWRKLCFIAKYYQQHMEIKKNGYFIIQMAFCYVDKRCRRFNDKVMMLARYHGFHANSYLSSDRDQFLINVMKNTVDRKFENEVKQLMTEYNAISLYDF